MGILFCGTEGVEQHIFTTAIWKGKFTYNSTMIAINHANTHQCKEITSLMMMIQHFKSVLPITCLEVFYQLWYNLLKAFYYRTVLLNFQYKLQVSTRFRLQIAAESQCSGIPWCFNIATPILEVSNLIEDLIFIAKFANREAQFV